jgi:hypothetical protein
MNTTTVRTWEYKLEALKFTPLDMDNPLDLNALGADGWELVSVKDNPIKGAAPFLCFFKRQGA